MSDEMSPWAPIEHILRAAFREHLEGRGSESAPEKGKTPGAHSRRSTPGATHTQELEGSYEYGVSYRTDGEESSGY